MSVEQSFRSLRELRTKFPYVVSSLGIVWTAAGRWTFAWAGLLFIQGLLPTAGIYLTRSAVDALVSGLNGGIDPASLMEAFLPVSLLAGVMVLAQLAQSASDWVRTIQTELVQDHMASVIHGKSTTVDLAFYDSPDFYDRLHRTRAEATTRPLALLENAGVLAQHGLTFATMSAVLVPYGWWLPPFLLLSTVPAFLVILGSNRRQHEWRQAVTPLQRKANYFDALLTERWYAEEVRLFGFSPYARDAYHGIRARLRSERLDLLKRQTFSRLASEMLALLVAGGAMAWMILRALSGAATLGDIALFYQAFDRGQTLMKSVTSSLGQMYTNMLSVENLFDFLKMKPTVVDPPHPAPTPDTLRDCIEFRNVVFRYPGSERVSLDNFSLKIPAGRTVAIVGPNGAGKSTLVKLLCRFYDPDQGCLTFDGTDVRSFATKDIRRFFALLLQVHVNYFLTARDNITIGDVGRSAPTEEVQAAAKAAGAHDVIERLPQGYDTQLGTWFAGGTNLSSGEWQRLATARAFFRSAQVLVLDEPTSFMDSWAEAEWFRRLRRFAGGRTSIIITHRFTIAMRADVIHVMDKGRIVESGTHDELLALGGLYAQSWASQMAAASVAPALQL